MKILVILAAIVLQLTNLLHAQDNPGNRIIAYFATGVSKNVSQKTQTIIASEKISSTLSKYNINASNIKAAFPGFTESDTVDAIKGEMSRQMNRAKIFIITTPDSLSSQKLLAELNAMPEVLYAEEDGTTSVGVIPSDTRFNQQWNMRNTVHPGADCHAEQAWNIYTGNPNAIIAIVDNGVDVNHNDLGAKISGGTTGFQILVDELGRQFSHGSHVAGIAAAISNNGVGVSGVDWQAKIQPRQVIGNGSSDAAINQAIIDAVNSSANLWTLNHSWNLTDGVDQWGVPIPGRYSVTVRQAFAYAYRNNRVSCAAMGNHQNIQRGTPNRYDNVVAYPAGFNTGVIAVGATNDADVLANFSARGPHVDVAAPGVAIISTNFNNDYIDLSGTSMATPHVSGLASLLKGFNTNLANDDIEQIIRLSSDDRGTTGFDNLYGTGRINAERALQLLQNNQLNQWSVTGGTVFNTEAAQVRTFLGVPGLPDANYSVKRIEVRINVTYPTAMCTMVGVWGRGVGTTGYREEQGRNFGEGICEVVPGTATNTGATLRTWIYQVYSMSGQQLGYYPRSAGNVVFQYTVLGNPRPNSIQGSNPLCASSGVYQLNTLPPGLSVTWQSSNTAIATVSTGNSTTVTRLLNGTITLTGTLNHTCGGTGNFAISKNLVMGAPPVFPLTIDAEPCGYYVYATTANIEGASAYLWRLDNYNMQTSTPYISIPGTTTIPGQPSFPLPAGTHTLQVKVQNLCGTSAYPVKPPPKTFTTSTCTPPLRMEETSSQDQGLKIYPNPVVNSLTVELAASTKTAANSTITELRVTDKLGTTKKQVRFNNKQSWQIVDVSNLPNDVYMVSVFNGKGWISAQVVIQH